MLLQHVVNSRSEYKYVLLNKKCIRHLLNRIQSKDHRIGTYSAKFHCLTLMMKYIFKTVDMMD